VSPSVDRPYQWVSDESLAISLELCEDIVETIGESVDELSSIVDMCRQRGDKMGQDYAAIVMSRVLYILEQTVADRDAIEVEIRLRHDRQN